MLEKYKVAYRDYRQAAKQLNLTQSEIEKLRRDEDYIRFQLDELQSLNFKPDEDAELEALQSKLSNITELKESLWDVENQLSGEENSILDRLSIVAQRLEDAERNLSDVEGMPSRVRTSLIDLKDIAQSVASIVDTLNDDPAELDRVNDRLNSLYTLQRKHNAQDVNQLLDIQHDYERQLSEIEHNDDILNELQARVSATREVASQLAIQLSAQRHQAAKRFGEELLALAMPLGLKNIAFRPMPVKDTASGGEISRVMLCIKTIIARHMQLPSIIFDEVDTGVSGDVANMIGEMMLDIASTIQVIAITHLPQVAANGDHHLRVFKTDTQDETLTRVETLGPEEHVMEIARMLSGKDLNQAAIDNAKSLINNKKRQ